jgi:hypothetical protein
MDGHQAFGRMKRIGGSLALGAALLLGGAGPVAADTGPVVGPPQDFLSAELRWTDVKNGAEFGWTVIASVDRISGEKSVFLFYTSSTEAPCGQGVSGTRIVGFDATAPGAVLIGPKLSGAVAIAKVRGLETTELFCEIPGGLSVTAEGSRFRQFTVSLGLVASGPADVFSGEPECLDFQDGKGEVPVTASSTFRPANGWAAINRDVVVFKGPGGPARSAELARLQLALAPELSCDA